MIHTEREFVNMEERYTEQELKEIFKSKGRESEKIQKKMEETYQMIEEIQKMGGREKPKITRNPMALAGGMAAAFAVCIMTLGISNPVLAAKLPVIGAIFQAVQDKVSYSGDFSKDATQLVDTENAKEVENNLVQTDQGITVTISEIARDDKSFYLGMTMISEEGFPEDFNRVNNDTEYVVDYDIMNCETVGELVDADGNKLDMSGELGILEGNFVDNHTFQTIGYIDLSDYDKVSDNFTYNFEITDIWSYLGQNYYGNWTYEDRPEEGEKHYNGSWKFSVDVSMDKSSAKVREVNQTNEQGIGIATVTKGKYYITAEPIVPENENYIVLIYDANGNRLESFGSNVEYYSVKDRDTDKITVCVCPESDFFMYKTQEDKLKEHVVYQTEVQW